VLSSIYILLFYVPYILEKEEREREIEGEVEVELVFFHLFGVRYIT
jgi:hypothetical protein